MGQRSYWWAKRHQCSPCVETLRIWTPRRSRVHLAIRFEEGKGCVYGGDGLIGVDGFDEITNINQPGVVASLISAALGQGWDPCDSKVNITLDGVNLLQS